MAKTLKIGPVYNSKVLIGNWVEDRIECPKQGTFYNPPSENIDYEKVKAELRRKDFSENKLNSQQGNVGTVIRHDSHSACNNYTTTNDLVYNHLPKPLCGALLRRYKKSAHQMYPQPDLTKCFGNLTEWGLKNYKQYEWECTDVSDYISSQYNDTYTPPYPGQYLQGNERKARNASFTKSFNFKFTKSNK